jgi:hypothetical protein
VYITDQPVHPYEPIKGMIRFKLLLPDDEEVNATQALSVGGAWLCLLQDLLRLRHVVDAALEMVECLALYQHTDEACRRRCRRH